MQKIDFAVVNHFNCTLAMMYILFVLAANISEKAETGVLNVRNIEISSI